MKRGFALAAAGAMLVTGACADTPKHLASTTTTVPTLAASTTTTTTLPRTFDDTRADDVPRAAAAITAAEQAALDPTTSPVEVRNAALALQLGYRKIAASDPSVEAAISAALPDDATRHALGFNVRAARELIALTGTATLKDAPPAAWRLMDPAPEAQLVGYYKEAAAASGVPWTILAAVNFVETRLGRIQGVSSAGAQGPMQFLPSTWAAYGNGGDINSVHDSIMTAANYLHANGAPERLDDAIFRYNHSAHYVAAIKAYAARIAEDERSFRGYHEWQVLYRTNTGVLLLPTGWPSVAAIPVA